MTAEADPARAIIEPALFARVQKRLAARGGHRTGPRATFPLTGLLFCKHCGQAMQGATTSRPDRAGNPGAYRYQHYVCGSYDRLRRASTCGHHTLPAERVTRWLAARLAEWCRGEGRALFTEELQREADARATDPGADLKRLEKEAARLDKEIGRLVKAVRTIDAPELLTELQAARAERDRVAADVACAKRRTDPGERAREAEEGAALLETLAERLQDVEPSVLREALRLLVVRIDCTWKAEPTKRGGRTRYTLIEGEAELRLPGGPGLSGCVSVAGAWEPGMTGRHSPGSAKIGLIPFRESGAGADRGGGSPCRRARAASMRWRVTGLRTEGRRCATSWADRVSRGLRRRCGGSAGKAGSLTHVSIPLSIRRGRVCQGQKRTPSDFPGRAAPAGARRWDFLATGVITLIAPRGSGPSPCRARVQQGRASHRLCRPRQPATMDCRGTNAPLRAQNMNVQFSLARLLQLAAVVAVVSALFAGLKWPVALLALCGLNVLAAAWFWLTKRPRVGGLAAETAILVFAALIFTDWGLSSLRPVVRIAWPWLIAACIAELVTIASWMVSVPPIVRARPVQTSAAPEKRPRPLRGCRDPP